jgi:ectoine hydroxylase
VRWDRSGAHGRTIVMDTLERSGFAIVEDALSADAVAHLTSAVDRVAAERGGDSIHELGFVGLDPAFVELVDHPATLPIVLNALGSNIFLYHCHLDVHPPAPPHGRWGWHQDGGRQNVDLPSPRPKLSLKVAFLLTDVEEETQAPMWIVPGSHRRDRLERDNTRPTGATPLLVSAGTAVIFDRRLWHARGDNTSTRTRKALFYAYTYRWIRARDDLRGVDAKFLDTLDPVRRQLLGGGPTTYGYWFPTEDNAPLVGTASNSHVPAQLGENPVGPPATCRPPNRSHPYPHQSSSRSRR